MEDIIETGRRLAESYNRKGEGFDNIGKKNAYECPDCGAYMVSIDRHPGVTPFMTKCGNCSGFAQSKMYRVSDRLTPTHEWYRPERLEDIPPGSEDHISRGGLVLREIDGERGWTANDQIKRGIDMKREHTALQAMMAKVERAEGVISKIDFPNVMTRQQIRHAARKDRNPPEEITMFGHRYQRID
jgi:hypothetical protein